MNSALTKLIVNLFLIDHLINRSNIRIHSYKKSSISLSKIAAAVSSGKRVRLHRSNKNGKSFIYTRNNRGPKILPCGTAIAMFFNVEFIPFKDTIFFSLDK